MRPHDHAHGHDDHASSAQHETHDEPLADEGHGDHGHGDHKPHESPWVMLVPLIVLSIGAVFAGFVFHRLVRRPGRHEFWRGAIFTAPPTTCWTRPTSSPLW
jgi:NADH-quinone oxidoreductase subunit L